MTTRVAENAEALPPVAGRDGDRPELPALARIDLTLPVVAGADMVFRIGR